MSQFNLSSYTVLLYSFLSIISCTVGFFSAILESFCWFPWATFYLQLKQWPIPTLCGRYELHTKTSWLNILLDLGIVMNQLKYSSPHMPFIPPSKLTRMKIKIKYIWKNSNKSYRNSKTAKISTHIYKCIRKKSPL